MLLLPLSTTLTDHHLLLPTATYHLLLTTTYLLAREVRLVRVEKDTHVLPVAVRVAAELGRSEQATTGRGRRCLHG